MSNFEDAKFYAVGEVDFISDECWNEAIWNHIDREGEPGDEDAIGTATRLGPIKVQAYNTDQIPTDFGTREIDSFVESLKEQWYCDYAVDATFFDCGEMLTDEVKATLVRELKGAVAKAMATAKSYRLDQVAERTFSVAEVLGML